MVNQAAKQEEKLADRLFDQFLTARLGGNDAATDHLLSECPASRKTELQEAIQGAEAFMREYLMSYVRLSVLEDTRQGLETLKRNKERQEELRERASEVWDLGIEDPADHLVRLVREISPAYDVKSGLPERGDAQMRVYNRGEATTSTKNSNKLGDVWRRAREPIIAAKVEETLELTMVSKIPINLNQVVRQLCLVVEQGSLEGDLEGMLATDGEVGAILINASVANPQRRRFTLAHEIGHFVLHRDKHAFHDTAAELRDYSTSTVEVEANTFASMLLMPTSLLPESVGRDKPSLEQADDVSARFNVSLEATLRRMIGLSHWRSALVISQDGAVTGSARSPLFDGFIKQGSKLHPDTMARMLFETDGPGEDGTVLPVQVWVEGPLAEEDIDVHEQSRRLSSGFVYSLITVMDPND